MNKIIKSLIILLFVCIITPLFFIELSADTGYDEALFNSANTYNLGVEEKIDHYKFTFDKNNKNDNVVDDKPSITFFTHGLSGKASDLSRDISYKSNKFGYNEESILNALHKKVDSNMYLCEFVDEFEFELYKITDTNNKYSYTKIDHITDASKHSFVCYSGYNTSEGNDYIYSQFNMMASYVINDIKNLKGGVLPKVNLIGHSRGGLTNMQYALDHPDIVDSIYSLNTPYLGTTIAIIDYNTISESEGIVENGGIRDIQDNEVYMSYYNRWNDDYDDLYKDINVYAFGMYQEIEMLIYQLLYTQITDLCPFEDLLPIVYTLIGTILRIFADLPRVIETYNGLSRYMANDRGKAALAKLIDELYVEKAGVVFEFDGLVDLDSQLGTDKINNYSYKGFNQIVYKLTIEKNATYKGTARGGMAATHAAAPYIFDVVNYIKDTIRL